MSLDTTHVAGATSKIIKVKAIVISTGLPYTAGAFNTAGISATYTRDGAAATTITLVTATAGTYTSSGFVHAGKGVYEIGAPTAALAAGADGVIFSVDGISDVLFSVTRCELVGADPRSSSAVAANVTQWSGTNVATVDTAGYPKVTVKSGTGAGELNTTSGVVDANATKVSGTAQTARDLGASVLISSGTGTGQLDVTSGVIKANLAQILGTALTETAGQIAAGFKQFFNIASPTSTMNTVTAVTTVNGLASNTITAASIATGAVTAAKFAASAIDATAIAAGAITAGKFATDAIDANALAAGAVTEIQTGLATSSALTTVSSNVTAIKAKTDSLTFTKAGEVDANVQSVNDVTIIGDGSATKFHV